MMVQSSVMWMLIGMICGFLVAVKMSSVSDDFALRRGMVSLGGDYYRIIKIDASKL